MFWKVFGIVCGVGLAVGLGVGGVIAVKQHKAEQTAAVLPEKPKVVRKNNSGKKAPKAA